jgi:DNA-binding NarL/FixJ family response regulator
MLNRAHLDSENEVQISAHAAVRAGLSTPAPRRERFRLCTESLVHHLDAAAVRIWLVANLGRTLVLQASSEARATPGDLRPHVPVAGPALSRIIETCAPYVTQDVVNDPCLKGRKWPQGSRMAYAGYPLRADARAIGVLAMFSRAPIRQEILETLRTTADMIAQTVRTRLHESTYRSDVSVSESKRLDSLLGAMQHVIGRRPFPLERVADLQVLRDRYTLLSRREREVMTLIVGGALNKQVGDRLGISEITVKAHRGQVMRKMKAYSLADLVKIAVLLHLTSWA